MQSFSFLLTPIVKQSLITLEICRRDILLSPINPKTERKLLWQTMLTRLTHVPYARNTPKSLIEKTLSNMSGIRLSGTLELLVYYRDTLSHISQEWLVNPRPITIHTLETLTPLQQSKLVPEMKLLHTHERDIRPLLNYVQTPNDHPATQAAIGFISLQSILADQNPIIPYMLAYILLYKNSFDLRGFIALEEAWNLQSPGAIEARKQITASNNLTAWLEYALQAFVSHANTIKTKLDEPVRTELPAHFFDLSDRQKTILAFLETPGTTITNKKVQKRFHISQITASRDLSKLASLGIIATHGKGRSVHYSHL